MAKEGPTARILKVPVYLQGEFRFEYFIYCLRQIVAAVLYTQIHPLHIWGGGRGGGEGGDSAIDPSDGHGTVGVQNELH